MLRLTEATIRVGGNVLLSDADWHIRESDHVGLVGRNGTGKSTLLKTLIGQIDLESGQLHTRGGILVGYLPQQAVSGSTDTVWNEAKSRMTRFQRLEEAVQRAQAAVDAGESGAIERLADATEAFRVAGGYALDERIGEVLGGLGFGPDSWHRSCDTFSGGWQMRIALARLLLSEPDVALLDEPTNHLDLHARLWLADFLAKSKQATVIVSHDRHLLDRFANRIVEVRNKGLHHYGGNFSKFLAERELRMEQQLSAHARQQQEIAKLERFVERFGAKATKASQARSRQKQLDKMDRIDAPTQSSKPRFRLPEAPASAWETLAIRDGSVGWDDQPLLSDLELTFSRGMRVAILGPNGAGKSTLLHALNGGPTLLSGRRKVDERVRLGLFTQDLAADLPKQVSPVEYISGLTPLTPPEKIRSILGALGLPGEMALRQIGELSGGEKARVALTALAATPHNVLFLDEPTNHLDVETVEVLVQALRDFEGTLVLVSHDRYLVEQVATHVIHIHEGHWSWHEGVPKTAFDPVQASALSTPEATVVESSQGAVDHAERKRLNRRLEKARRELAKTESDISAAEEELEAIDSALCDVGSDYEKATELGQKRQAIEARSEALYEAWEQLEEEIGTLETQVAP